MQLKNGRHELGATLIDPGSSCQNNSDRINIGVSGKRFVPVEERQRIYDEIKKRIDEILEQHQVSDFVAFTALAEGADTIFAQVVTKEFHKRLHVILPFSLEEYKKDFSEQDLKTLLELLRQSRETEIASQSVPVKPDDRGLSYFVCGRRIVDACDDMVFVWDEQKPGGTGGTAEIMGYFGEKNKHGQVAYIKVSPANKDALDRELMTSYEVSNSAAIKARDRYRLVWKSAILIGWLAAGCFAWATAFHIEGIAGLGLTCLEFLFVGVVYLLIYFARKLNYHGLYLEKRCEAETYRLLKIFYHTGVKVKISDRSNEETVFSRLADRVNKGIDESASISKWYSQYAIKELIRSQGEYHKSKIKSIGNKHAVYEGVSRSIGLAFLINLAVHVVHLYLARDSAPQTMLYKLCVFLNIELPAAYAAVEGFIYFNEWTLLKKNSASSDKSLSEVQLYLPQDIDNKTIAECHNDQAAVLNFISGIMLTDNKNWKTLLQNKDNYNLIV